MKFFLTIFIVFSLLVNGFSQKLEVLLIGVAHDYSKSEVQDLSNIQHKIRAFKPTAFFGEFVSPDDEVMLMDYWCKADNIKRLKNLQLSRFIPVLRLSKVIDSLKSILLKDSLNFYAKIDLAHAYYLSQDAANGHYLYWQVYDHLKRSEDDKLRRYMDSLLHPDKDVSGRSMKRLLTSEYALIAFPMMNEFKIKELLSMDCQDYDLNWTASAVAFHEKFGLFQKDTLQKDFSAAKSILNKRDRGFRKYGEMERSSKKFTEWLNTDQAAGILASGDFLFEEMYNLQNFPKQEMLSQIHWWMKRNKQMCSNVVDRARKANLKKVVVMVGANHRRFMQDIFKKMPSVSVLDLSNVEPN